MKSDLDAENSLTIDYVILAFAGFSFLSIFPFTIFHYWLQAKGITTNEY